MRANPLIPSFNAGELSPYMAARADYAQFGKGLQRCENFIPLVQGALDRRPGTRFVAPCKTDGQTATLVDFIFSNDDAYILEFGDQYIRFFTNRGQVLANGQPYEIVSPYPVRDLPLLRFAQSGDVVYIAHPLYAPRKLLRQSATNWQLVTVDFENGPIGVENTDRNVTIKASATTGTVLLTANADLFTAQKVGAFVRLRHRNNGGIKPWAAGEAVALNAQRSYNGRFYRANNSATTKGDPPVHSEDLAYDGEGGVEWEYLHDGAGIAKIVSVQGARQATAVITSRLPDDTVTNNTEWWSFGDWSPDNGYPGAVCFYGDRLFWGGSPKFPQRIWGSVVGDYENHKPGTDGDSALSLTLSAAEINIIRWMVNDEKGLLIGTARGEWIVRPSSQNEALTPTNAKAAQVHNYGSNATRPARVGRAIMFVQSAARKLREMAYALDADGFAAPDLTVRAEHITASGITSLAYQAQPDPIIWATRADGVLLGFTYERDQEVLAWHRHLIGGHADANKTLPAAVESVAAIPAPDGSRDDLWMIVRRTINGRTRRYVEILTPRFGHETPAKDAIFVDSAVSYSGPPATVVSGAGHLDGEIVLPLVDGAAHPPVQVSSGSVTLERAGQTIHIGLPYQSLAQTERLEAAAPPGGTAQGAKKRFSRILLRLYRSGPVKAGPSVDKLHTYPARRVADATDAAPPLQTADVESTPFGGWERDGTVVMVADTAMPATILAVVPALEVNP